MPLDVSHRMPAQGQKPACREVKIRCRTVLLLRGERFFAVATNQSSDGNVEKTQFASQV